MHVYEVFFFRDSFSDRHVYRNIFLKSCKMLYLDILNIMNDIEVKYMICYTRKMEPKICQNGLFDTFFFFYFVLLQFFKVKLCRENVYIF